MFRTAALYALSSFAALSLAFVNIAQLTPGLQTEQPSFACSKPVCGNDYQPEEVLLACDKPTCDGGRTADKNDPEIEEIEDSQFA